MYSGITIGWYVENAQGGNLNGITDLLFDFDTGQIAYVVMAYKNADILCTKRR